MADNNTTSKWDGYAQLFDNYLERTDMRFRIQELVDSERTRMVLDLDNLRQIYPQLVASSKKERTFHSHRYCFYFCANFVLCSPVGKIVLFARCS